MRALIAGGGIAGLACGVALRRAGIAATVLERRDAATDEAGSWLQVAGNGMAALEALGLGEVASGLGEPSGRLRTHAADGRTTADMPFGPRPGRGPSARTLMRAELHGILRQEAERQGVDIIRGARVTSAEQDVHGASLVTATGERHSADLVIGADGVRSAVRATILPPDPAAAPAAPTMVDIVGSAAAASLPEEYAAPAGTLQFRFGRDCFVATVALRDGSTWWFANPRLSALPGGAASAAHLSPDEWAEAVVRLAAPDALPVEHLVAEAPRLVARLSARAAPQARWGSGRCVLVGDAAHTMPSTSGQGASLALEDAVVLGRIIGSTSSPTDVVASLARRRDERVARIIAQGTLLDRSKLLGPVGSLLRDRVVLPLAARDAARTGSGPSSWMYEFTDEG
ncbi:FAD-dependent oxidoreductase [Clavibacter sepedonicus]|nr:MULTISPECIES: NAD(P)/FAD-dependent oxidoreductase [Clavibacter]MBD5380504.1 FAD-dependent monooxygenase [Clavibacter sp.]UUK66167.1 FAD-dependent monooxygenase [Clavibacter sepedonicus]